ncbi:MAG: FecR domain-containing protein [Chitinispirillales bacterium]|nr:FecR domain-containing protein [Chitinispirillales bacterium]
MSALRSKIFGTTLLLALFSARPLLAAADVVEERVCTVTGVMGNVRVRYSPNYNKMRREPAVAKGMAAAVAPVSGSITGEWSKLRLGMTVGGKCEIMTGAESEVRLETADGTIVKVEENALVEVAVLQAVTRKAKSKGAAPETAAVAKFKLLYGSLVGSVKKITRENPDVRFETPTAAAAIRGTVIEVEVAKNTNTLIRAFDGTILVAPVNKKNKFVELGDGKMVELVPKQTVLLVRDVPKGYRRKGFLLKGEKAPAPVKESKKSEKPREPVAVKLRLDLGDIPDTLSCYAGDTVMIDGTVAPASARVSVNGVAAAPDKDGAFRVAVPAPDSGTFPLNIAAESGTTAEYVVRAMRVAHVHTAARLITPVEGEVVKRPVVLISGTAEPGSKVNVLGVTLNVQRDGTFSGEAGLPPREGTVKVQVEIVNRDDTAVWIERNIRYKK